MQAQTIVLKLLNIIKCVVQNGARMQPQIYLRADLIRLRFPEPLCAESGCVKRFRLATWDFSIVWLRVTLSSAGF